MFIFKLLTSLVLAYLSALIIMIWQWVMFDADSYCYSRSKYCNRCELYVISEPWYQTLLNPSLLKNDLLLYLQTPYASRRWQNVTARCSILHIKIIHHSNYKTEFNNGYFYASG